MSWLARTEQACVAVEVVITFYWADDIGVDDCSRVTVPFLVTVVIGRREEHHFVGFGNDNKCDLGVETESFTCVYGLAVASRRARSLGVKTRGKGGDELRIRLSSSLIFVLNSPSETPSWETFVMFGRDIGQKTWHY